MTVKRFAAVIGTSVCLLTIGACSVKATRGIADSRSNFEKFVPMEGDPVQYGLKAVNPYFKGSNRGAVLGAIASACTSGKEGSSVFDQASGRGYYVNCNPRNRQVLNGYIPLDPHHRPHSR